MNSYQNIMNSGPKQPPCDRFDLVELTFMGAHGKSIKTAEISAVHYSQCSGVDMWALVLLPCDLDNSIKSNFHTTFYSPERPMHGLKSIRIIGNNNPQYIEKLTKI